MKSKDVGKEQRKNFAPTQKPLHQEDLRRVKVADTHDGDSKFLRPKTRSLHTDGKLYERHGKKILGCKQELPLGEHFVLFLV